MARQCNYPSKKSSKLDNRDAMCLKLMKHTPAYLFDFFFFKALSAVGSVEQLEKIYNEWQ